MTDEKKEICIGRKSGKTYNKIQEMAKEIVRLQKVIDLMAELCIKLGCELSLVKEVKEFTDMCFGCKYEDEECNRNDCIERLIEYYTKKAEED